MTKYIIKNCPAILKMSQVCDDYRTTRDNPQLCKDITDCLMKRVVDKCHTDYCLCDNCDGVGYFDGCKDTNCSFYRLMQIEAMLDIEEVE